ncbi:hypothetical protein KAU45_09630 [bacterium]|nr:hypothetical protein [bacterium]
MVDITHNIAAVEHHWEGKLVGSSDPNVDKFIEELDQRLDKLIKEAAEKCDRM